MDKRTRILFSPAVLLEAQQRFDIPPGTLREVGGFESFIYEYEQEGQAFIFRISHSLHNPPQRTRGEMAFLEYLSGRGLSVPRPRASRSGQLVEVIDVHPPNGSSVDLPALSHFSAVSFDKAPGRHPTRNDWQPPLFYQMGRFLGRLHTLSKEYQPAEPGLRRHEWYEDQEDYAVRFLPLSETLVISKFNQLVSYLKALPRDPEGYGLIHLDFHSGNFFIDGEGALARITLFDFDDCAYAPYVYDIAMALFYAVPHHCDSPADIEAARTFYRTFMSGYVQENDLDLAWLKEIPFFLKLREMDLYTIIHRSFEMDKLGPWEASYMEGRKERLEKDVPFIDMDFSL